MRKIFKKIISVCAAALLGTSILAVSACDGVYKGNKLEGSTIGAVVSNGGFAVQKGNYIYYINGKQSNQADNTLGKVQTGAIMRISKSDLASKHYENTQTVVPEIVHSGNNNAGIFIYGDYVYYSTPSAEKNSDGEIQYSDIVFKRARLDGSEVMKGSIAKYSSNSIEYRFVEVNGTVYLLYVATSENLYGTSYTNLHSVNVETKVDTVLAYNVDSVMFDSADLTNPRVYYTMKARDFRLGKTYSNYNQVYTVTADATTPNDYKLEEIVEDYDAEKDPLYINCGSLVLDGIGMVDGNLNITPFNAPELKNETGVSALTRSPYTYTLSKYQNGTLFYTRTSTNNSTASLFKESETELLALGHQPAVGALDLDKCLLIDGSNASTYTYIFDNNNNLTGAFISSSNGLVKAAVADGKLETEIDNDDTFYLTTSGTPTILFTDGDYVYYSESGSGANGYIIKRLNYSGTYDNYNKMPEGDDVNEYTAVRILDLDCSSDWYKPEMFEGHIFFSSQTKNISSYGSTSYSHIMVCDINGESGIMTNAELEVLNEQYKSISEKIEKVDESNYKNLKNAYYYAFYTGDGEYIDKLIKAYVDKGEDEEMYWSKESVEKFKQFLSAEGDWSDFAHSIKVNGQWTYANQQAYYYSLLGKMTDENREAFDSYVKNTYMQAWPEEEESWFNGLSAGAKAGFLIGVIGGGLILIGAGVVVALVIIRKRKEKLPEYTKKRIKVDTTDDKSVDVYATEESENKTEE